MPADPSTQKTGIGARTTGLQRKRSLTSKRGAIACVRCKERKAKCVPAPPGTSNVPTCTNCFTSKAECVYLERTPNEIFLLEYVSQLEARIALLELELIKYHPTSSFTADHEQARTAAVDALTLQYPQPEEEVKVKEEPGGEEDLALGIGLLSLGGSGEPLYVGASSGVNWARLCASVLRRPLLQPSNQSRFSYLAPPELASVQSALSYSVSNPIPNLPTPALASHYIDVVYTHIQARYGFLDWPAIRSWHANREEICLNRPMWGVGQGADERRALSAFFLWLIYGYGARLTEDEDFEGACSHEVYYNAAVACLSTLTSQHSLATVQALLLLTIYSFRHPKAEMSIWQVGGLALRTAVELGLHRRTRSRSEREADPLRYEAKKRTFWSLYTLDRMMALQLGRPSGIQDRDIDVELPLNIDADYTDSKAVFMMQNRQHDLTVFRRPGEEYSLGYDCVTSMTSSIHNVRLNQLKQSIQDAIYGVDTPLQRQPNVTIPGGGLLSEIDSLLLRLAKWKDCTPILPPGRAGVPLLSKAHFDMEYHNMLLRPIITGKSVLPKYTIACAESAAALCEIQYALLQPVPKSPRLSTWALYRLFVSGLTLLHIVSSSPFADLDRASTALFQCQQTLAVFVISFKGAAGYEECFKDLVAAWESKRAPTVSPVGRSYEPQPVSAFSNTIFSPQFQSQAQPTQTTSAFASTSAFPLPLLGSPESTEAFSDQWAGRLGEMGGRMGGGMRDDFFSLMSSFGLDTVLESVNETLPPVGEEEMWTTNDWEMRSSISMPSFTAQAGMGEWQTGQGGLNAAEQEELWRYPFA